MKDRYKRFACAAVLVAFAAVLALPSAALAEHHENGEHAAPAYRQLHFDYVYPEHAEAFEANAKAWVEAFQNAEMGPDWMWFASQGTNFSYVWLSPFGSFAELDETEARQKHVAETLGEDKMKELMAGAGYVRQHRTEVIKHVPELSYVPAPDEMGIPGFIHVTVHWVKPSMEDSFKEAVKGVKEAYAKIEYPHSFETYQIVFGEGSYAIVSTGENAAEYYGRTPFGANLAKALGEEGAEALFQKWRESVTDFDTEDYTSRPDLSFMPGMGMEMAKEEMGGS